MSSDTFKYLPLKNEEFQILWQKHIDVIEEFIQKNHYSTKNLYVDEKTIMEIIVKVDQRKKYFQYFHNLDISEFKDVSLICFWYIKLKPICISSEDLRNKGDLEAINEKLALYYLLSTYRRMLKNQKLPTNVLDNLPSEYLKELIYSFRYRDISKEAFILLVESIAVFLGLEPYQKINK